jgi:hypothetical protein
MLRWNLPDNLFFVSMTRTRLLIIALLAAFPLEALNLWVCPFPVDVGYPDNVPWYIDLRGSVWVIMHLLGLRLTDWFQRVGLHSQDLLIVFVGGYIETALLLIIAIFCVGWFRHRAKPHVASQS